MGPVRRSTPVLFRLSCLPYKGESSQVLEGICFRSTLVLENERFVEKDSRWTFLKIEGVSRFIKDFYKSLIISKLKIFSFNQTRFL